MRINSISTYQRFNFLQNKNNTSNPIYRNSAVLDEDKVEFRGQKQDDRTSLKALKSMFTNRMEKTWDEATKIAQISGSPTLESWHLYLASLYSAKRQLEEIEQGISEYNDPSNGSIIATLQNTIDEVGAEVAKEEERKKILEVVNNHIEEIKKDFLPQDPKRSLKNTLITPKPSKRTMDDLIEAYNFYKSAGMIDRTVDDSFPLVATEFSQDRRLVKKVVSFRDNLQKAVMIDNEQHKKKKHLTFFDSKADALWKNVSLGKDTIVLTEESNSSSTKHLVSSFINLINKPNQHYKNVSPENTNIILLNKNATFDFLNTLVREAKKKQNKTTVIIVNLDTLHASDGETIKRQDIDTLANIASTKDKSNVRLIFSVSKEGYYNLTSKDSVYKSAFERHSVQVLPTLNANDTIDYLTNENGIAFIEQETGKKFSPETIRKAIELTAQTNGNYPDKAINLLNTVSAYNPDVEDITPQMIVDYAREAKILNSVQNNNDDNIIFDTGKTLDDIAGSPMTKAQAESVVRAIKSGTIGTRGYIIHYNDDYCGGGRFHTAQAIAGEAEIPMIVINAKDFALKDIDTLSQNADFSEMKIKKIMSSAVAQAEANPDKCAMVYIKNFDNFAANPLTGVSSIYEQKAFSQLLDEMDSIRKNKNVNIIVMGSANIPEIIDDNIRKPYKFLDSIVVYPPNGTKETKDVIKYYINKMNLTIAGSEKTRNKTINNIAETASRSYFNAVDIMYLLETAKNVATERNKEAIDSKDLMEAYQRTTSGRVNTGYINDIGKKITTTHEAGHAINLQVMYDLMKKQGLPWQLPNKVDFITLDPRGDYLGAVYPKRSENTNLSFESLMGELICDYGGYSAEKRFYNINGSHGIIQDMQLATDWAERAVLDYGMGKNTGVKHISRNPDGTLTASEHKKELIEKDIDAITQGAMLISDAIVETYKGFIEQFTQKYYKKIGTGNCTIPGEKFKKELDAWKNSLSDEEKEKITHMELYILNTLKSVQNGTFDGSPFIR